MFEDLVIKNALCTQIEIRQTLPRGGILGGPKTVEFSLSSESESIIYTINIEQLGVRDITVSSNQPVTTKELWGIFSSLDMLLMIFDGHYIPIETIHFSGGDNDKLSKITDQYILRRPSLYTSANFAEGSINTFISFDKILTSELFSSWIKMKQELDLIHPMVSYCMAQIELPVDCKCASMIEIFEPLVELINKYNSFFPTLKPGEKGTTLKMCLDASISKFGAEIFRDEFMVGKEQFLQILVDSRVRIMHIRSKQNEIYLDGKESVLYIVKLSYLYRRILLELLRVDYLEYVEPLKKAVSEWGQWAEVMDNFLKQKVGKING